MSDAPPTETVPLAYRSRGSGPPLVLVAGTGYAGGTWSPAFVDALAADYTVITFDHRGTGDSPVGDDRPYTTRLFAADALRLVREVGAEPAHVLGHSMGGRVAQWMAIDGPAAVASLLLVSTGAGSDAHPVDNCVPAHVALGLGEFGYEQFIRNVQATSFFTDAFAASDPDTVRWLGDAFWAGRPTLANYLRHVMARQAHYTRDRLHVITQPTLVTVGGADTHRGGTGSHVEQSEFLAANIAGARYEPIDGAKHGLFWENTKAILDLTREWLAERSR
jgi:pimeloyl-ACP methyl ester carboxylesterase